MMEEAENNKRILYISYKSHIIDLHPITDEMLENIPDMSKKDIQKLLSYYDKVIQTLMKNVL